MKMQKNKLIYLFVLISSLLLLNSCWNDETTTNNSNSWSVSTFTKYYNVDWEWDYNLKLYWNILADNTKNIVTTKGWKLTQLNCQPWTKVGPSTVIAAISPDFSDPTLQNNQIQISSLEQQKIIIENSITSTQSNYDLQVQQLKNQIENNDKQIELANQNLEILKKQKSLSSWDIDIQKQSLSSQINSVQNQVSLQNDNKSKDLWKINNSIKNQKDQFKNFLKNYLDNIDIVFGFTKLRKDQNDSFEMYLSVKNTGLKDTLETNFDNITEKLNNFDNLTNDEIINLYVESSDLLKLAADAINNSIANESLKQTTIDAYYNNYIAFSNNLISLKSAFDNTISSIDITTNNYDVQLTSLNSSLDTLKKNLDNLNNNKWESAILTLDNSINLMVSQISSYNTSQENLKKQIEWLMEQKNIQTNTLQAQITTLKQNIDMLKTYNSGETIYAWISWTVKIKKADLDNKVASNTLVCQIIPNNKWNLKIQIYSSKKLDINQKYEIIKDKEKVWEWKITFEAPFIDSTTQNYIYEDKINIKDVVDWDKVDIKLVITKKDSKMITIPLDFVIPKLEWYFVNICKDTTCNNYEEKQVKVWNINNGYIEIIDWLKKWDKLGK